MLVSWKWLSRYVELTLSHDDLAERLSLSGLNHEGSATVQEDTVIDLEVTSNRGDCLGHIGVAREIAVLTDQPLHVDPVTIDESESSIGENLQVDNRFLDACPRYTARIIRGVRVAPSPQWLQDSLIRVGIPLRALLVHFGRGAFALLETACLGALRGEAFTRSAHF